LDRLEGRKRWILAETARSSKIHTDAGAAQALVQQGKSLLSAGIVAIEGKFERGQTVRIFHEAVEIARGLTQYSAADLERIKGKRSAAIADVLGYDYGAAVVHRDDMVMMKTGE
jgi:glutamate 5-kinase